MSGFRGMTFQKSLAAFSAERVYSQAELNAAVAAEREACAQLCDAVAAKRWPNDIGPEADDCAAAIRARGQQ